MCIDKKNLLTIPYSSEISYPLNSSGLLLLLRRQRMFFFEHFLWKFSNMKRCVAFECIQTNLNAFSKKLQHNRSDCDGVDKTKIRFLCFPYQSKRNKVDSSLFDGKANRKCRFKFKK